MHSSESLSASAGGTAGWVRDPFSEPGVGKALLDEWLDSGAILGIRPRNDFSADFLLGIREQARSADPPPDGISFYANDFFLSHDKPWLTYQHVFWIRRDDLREALLPWTKTPQGYSQIRWQPPTRTEFESPFRDLQDRISRGELSKAVPLVFETSRFHPERQHRAQWIGRVLDFCGSAPVRVYGSWNPGEGWIGATPEILFELKERGRLSTVALAGTRRDRDRETLGPLLDDPKELQEHEFVIQGVSESLQGLGLTLRYPTQELALPGLSHLQTRLELRTDQELDFTDLIARLHPTPALGAYPKEAGSFSLHDLDSPRRSSVAASGRRLARDGRAAA